MLAEWSELDLTRIPRVTVSIDDVELEALEGALARAACAGVHLVDVRVPAPDYDGERDDRAALNDAVNSVLLAASRLAPVEVRLTFSSELNVEAQLPSFPRATSIELEGESDWACDPYIELAGSEFTALDRLSISGCVVDLADLVFRCPRLRVLRASCMLINTHFMIHSATLEEIAAVDSGECGVESIVIACPVLKHLALRVLTTLPRHVSLAAPLLEKVSWTCRFDMEPSDRFGLGLWEIGKLSIESPRSHAQGTLYVEICAPEQDTSLPYLLESGFAGEIAKLPAIGFSTLEIRVRFNKIMHDYGPVVMHLLGIALIGTATRKLKLDIRRWSVEKQVCPENCPCGDPNKLITQATYLGDLQEVEIAGLHGMDHEFDFVKRMLRCAPLLKRMSVRFFDEVAPSDRGYKKIHSIFTDYPLVDCYVSSNSGLKPGIRNQWT